ncbi:hypothetical protein Barb4_01368 [Bacteroidales bacterium Barb4]|nr:hypothetical protein Barb4_01368 [Bacteroidales bacterium Barb4]
MKKFIFSLFALVLFTACDKENDEILSPQQGEEQAGYNPKYPESKSFKEGEVRDLLVIMYGKGYNTHFVVRNAVNYYTWSSGMRHYIEIDDYDSRSYAKQNLDALGWHYFQREHTLDMDLVDPLCWSVIEGNVGDFDRYPHMNIPIKPFGTVVRPYAPPFTPEEMREFLEQMIDVIKNVAESHTEDNKD